MGKALLLQAAGNGPWAGAIVATVLAASLLMMVAFARTGSMLFWTPGSAAQLHDQVVPSPAVSNDRALPGSAHHVAPLALLAALIIACAVFAGPLSRYAEATAQQLFATQAYRQAVLGTLPVPPAYDVRREMRERQTKP